MSIFTDRRPLRQIGGVRAYLRQVGWSLKWRLEWYRRPLPAGDRLAPPATGAARPDTSQPAESRSLR